MTQLLIVHRDPEIGRDLVQVVKDYTGYESVLTHSESETVVWLRRQPEVRPQILLTHFRHRGWMVLSSARRWAKCSRGYKHCSSRLRRFRTTHGSSRLESFSGTNRRGTANRHDRAVHADVSGAPDLFHVLDILQMCCLSGRSGALQMVSGANVGTIYLRDGQVMHAETGTECGNDASLKS